MAAWADSPYRAIGVYIGGANRACSQPNLTAELGQRPDRRRLAPDPHLRRPAGADQQLQQLRQADLRPGGRPGRGGGRRRGRPGGRGRRSAPGSPIYFDMESYSPDLERHRRHPRLPRSLDQEAARARLRLRRLQQQRLRDRRPRRPGRQRLRLARRPLDRQLERPAEHRRPGGARHRLDRRTSASTSTAAATTRPTAASRSTSTTTTSTGRRSGPRTLPAAEDDPIGYARPGRSPGPGQVRVKGWAFDPDAPTEPLAIRVVVGGQAGTARALERYELGPIASQVAHRRRRQVPRSRRRATASTPPSRPSSPGRSRSASTRSERRPRRKTACSAARRRRSRSRSALPPAGDRARGARANRPANGRPGPNAPASWRSAPASRWRQRRGHGRPRGSTPSTRSLGRRTFHLTGARCHTFRIPLSAGGRSC